MAISPIGSNQSGLYDQVQQTNSATNSSAISELTTAQTDSTTTNASPAYSVEISQEGAELSSRNSSSASSDTASTSTVNDSSIAASSASPHSGRPHSASSQTASTDTTSTDTTNSTTETTDLTQYSTYQLQQMQNKGEITMTSYNQEMARRRAEQVTETTNSNGLVTE